MHLNASLVGLPFSAMFFALGVWLLRMPLSSASRSILFPNWRIRLDGVLAVGAGFVLLALAIRSAF